MNTIHKVVIHELVKEQHAPIQPSNLRSQVLDPSNAIVEKLVDGLTELYGSRNNSAHYGTFRTGAGQGDFPRRFISYSNINEPKNEEFMELSRVGMDELYARAEMSSPSSGGYILFVDYSSRQGRYFMIAMIKQKEGIRLSRNLEPEELTELDLNRLYQAAKISFAKLSSYNAAATEDKQDISYLSFVSPSTSKTAAGYFVTALGCAPGAASARATDTLYRESVSFFRNNESLKKHLAAFREKLLAYLIRKEDQGESARLSEVEELARPYMPAEQPGQADEMVNAFVSHLNSDENAVPVEFPVNKNALKKHTHITYSADNWDIKFERHAIGENDAAEIIYDRENGRLTIKNLPEKMIEKINEELDSRSVE